MGLSFSVIALLFSKCDQLLKTIGKSTLFSNTISLVFLKRFRLNTSRIRNDKLIGFKSDALYKWRASEMHPHSTVLTLEGIA